MAKRGNDQATQAAQSAQGLSNTLGANAQTSYAALMPELQNEVVNPQGFNPVDQARMRTEAEQGAGGSQAGAVGQGALLASRTKNPGTAAAAISEASRKSGEQLSKDTLAQENKNALLKESQRQEGLGGLQRLNATQQQGGIAALGEVAPAVNANTQAANQSWDWAKYILDPAMEAAGKGAGAAMA